MIIDAKKLGGMCSCGRVHEMQTKLCVIEAGALKRFDEYKAEVGFSGKCAVIYDENTYLATEGLHPKADKEIILSKEGLHADEHGVALASEKLTEDFDYLVAVGSGTVHDITRYIAYERKIPFISCPTAASVDGFCSSVAAMSWYGFKRTLTAVAPTIVIADTNVISNAPIRLARSGFGDMIGKYIALSDWKIGALILGEYFCEEIYKLTYKATEEVIKSAEGISRGDLIAYEKLTYGLLLSGIAMQMLTTSRCASGAEHHISHLIEMQPEPLSLSSEALHGEKVGVATLIAAREYHRMAEDKNIRFEDYKKATDEEIRNIFGDRLASAIVEENKKDVCEGISSARIFECWEKICEIISDIPTCEALTRAYERLSVKNKLSDISVDENMKDSLLLYSPLVRNRLTLMRLRRAMKR